MASLKRYSLLLFCLISFSNSILDRSMVILDSDTINKFKYKEMFDEISSAGEEFSNCLEKISNMRNHSPNFYYQSYLFSGRIYEDFGNYDKCFKFGISSQIDVSFLLIEYYNKKSKNINRVPYGICILTDCIDYYQYKYKETNKLVTNRSNIEYEFYLKAKQFNNSTTNASIFHAIIFYIIFSYIMIILIINFLLYFVLNFAEYNPYDRDIFKKTLNTNYDSGSQSKIQENSNSTVSFENSDEISGSNEETTFNLTKSNDSKYMNKSSENDDFIIKLKRFYLYYFDIKNLLYTINNKKCKIFNDNNDRYHILNGLIGFLFMFACIFKSSEVINITMSKNIKDKNNCLLFNGGPISYNIILSLGTNFNEYFIAFLGIFAAKKCFRNKIENSITQLFLNNIPRILFAIFISLYVISLISYVLEQSEYKPYIYLFYEGLDTNLYNLIPFGNVFLITDYKYKSTFSYYFISFIFGSQISSFLLAKLIKKSKFKLIILFVLYLIFLFIRALVVYFATDFDLPNDDTKDVISDIAPIFYENMNLLSQNFIYSIPNYIIGYSIGILLWMDETKNLLLNESSENDLFYGFNKLRKIIEHWFLNKLILILSLISFLCCLTASNVINDQFIIKDTNVEIEYPSHYYISYMSSLVGILKTLFLLLILLCIIHSAEPFSKVNIINEHLIETIFRLILENKLFVMIGRNIVILCLSYTSICFFIIVFLSSKNHYANPYNILFLFGFPSFCFTVILCYLMKLFVYTPIALMFKVKNYKEYYNKSIKIDKIIEKE